MHDDIDPQSFYDDSSGALGIGYSATSIKSASPIDLPVVPNLSPAERRELEQEREVRARRYQDFIEPIARKELAAASGPEGTRDPEGKLIPTNAGAYRALESRARELEGQGYSAVDAMKIAQSEAPGDSDEPTSREDYLGESVTALMSRKVAGKGGRSGGRKADTKTFPDRCKHADCHLQYCTHKSPRGRKKKPNGKTERVRARISKTAKAGFEGRNVSDEMEILGIALATGKTYEQVRRERAALQANRDVA